MDDVPIACRGEVRADRTGCRSADRRLNGRLGRSPRPSGSEGNRSMKLDEHPPQTAARSRRLGHPPIVTGPPARSCACTRSSRPWISPSSPARQRTCNMLKEMAIGRHATRIREATGRGFLVRGEGALPLPCKRALTARRAGYHDACDQIESPAARGSQPPGSHRTPDLSPPRARARHGRHRLGQVHHARRDAPGDERALPQAHHHARGTRSNTRSSRTSA